MHSILKVDLNEAIDEAISIIGRLTLEKALMEKAYSSETGVILDANLQESERS